MSEYHNPVLLHPSIDALVLNPDGFYADATFGGGGHSREILSRLSPKGRLMAFDRDEDALAQAPNDPRFILIHNNFRFIHNYTLLHAAGGLDGILADLGVSSHQFDTAERGFSFRFPNAPLDMRMNVQGGKTASDIVNSYTQDLPALRRGRQRAPGGPAHRRSPQRRADPHHRRPRPCHRGSPALIRPA